MRIIVDFDDVWAIRLIAILSVCGWIVTFVSLYYTYTLSTGADPIEAMKVFLPDIIVDGLIWLARNLGYLTVVFGASLSTYITFVVIKSSKKKRKKKR